MKTVQNYTFSNPGFWVMSCGGTAGIYLGAIKNNQNLISVLHRLGVPVKRGNWNAHCLFSCWHQERQELSPFVITSLFPRKKSPAKLAKLCNEVKCNENDLKRPSNMNCSNYFRKQFGNISPTVTKVLVLSPSDVTTRHIQRGKT